jgi:hypothetical protein
MRILSISSWVLVVVCALGMPQNVLAGPAQEPEKEIKASQIPWIHAPKYIQEQIRNVVMNCTQGTLTPDRAPIYEYAVPNQPSHYVYHFLPWLKQPLADVCSQGPSLCNQNGCLMIAYTQIKPDLFKQSLRTYVLGFTTKDMLAKDSLMPDPSAPESLIRGFEYTQSKYQCRLLNGAKSTCKMSFTWKDNKFTYFGGGRMESPAIVMPAERVPAEKIPAGASPAAPNDEAVE